MSYSETVSFKRRLAWLAVAAAALILVVAWRLFTVQVLSHQRYLSQAANAHSRKTTVAASRGEIFIRDGDKKTPLALNQTLKTLYADPSQVKDKAAAAKALAGVTGQPEAGYVKALQKPGDYTVLGRSLNREVAERVMALKLTGIGLSNQPQRVYPEGTLAAQVLGFVNADGQGQYGLEGYLNQELVGTPGLLRAKTDTRGNPIATADNFIKPAVNGTGYVLTLDRNIQAQAEKYLKEGVERVRAKSGSVVIVDPSNGAVKAMANFPTYDPNAYSQVRDYGLFSNAVVSDQFEPGSGFKIFTMAAGLATGKVKPDTTFEDTGSVEVDGRTIRNAANHRYGRQNMTDVIQKSLNTGVVFILKSLGGDPANINLTGKRVLHEYITKRFGFGLATGIEQAGEVAGAVNRPTNANGNNVNYANITFGQGVSVSMIQMATATAAIANGGKLYQPHLIDEVITPDGTSKPVTPKLVNGNVVTPEVARQLTDMMVQVVEKGSGYQTRIPGYKVAGKTGTAQIPRADGKGYEDKKNIGSFVGFAPAENPRFVMMVRINEPQTSGFAESTTVPVFGDIARWLLHYYKVEPQ
ncbi:penicillin-binding protein 2 [Candidatus Parcubacteria bacterium]|nr:penicillin-binding protein 2 [Candidatus Parcubacteria bacterium]